MVIKFTKKEREIRKKQFKSSRESGLKREAKLRRMFMKLSPTVLKRRVKQDKKDGLERFSFASQELRRRKTTSRKIKKRK